MSRFCKSSLGFLFGVGASSDGENTPTLARSPIINSTAPGKSGWHLRLSNAAAAAATVQLFLN